MLRTILRREFLEYLKSAKFLIGLLIVVVLTAASTLINTQDFVLRHQNYLDAKEELKSGGFELSVFREPHMLGILARGKDRDLGDFVKLSVMDVPRRLSGYMNVRRPKYPSLVPFSAVDFAFLVRVVLSLMVAFLAYNAISEEKSNGTLKLVMANALPRDKLLIGKWLSGLIIVGGSLLIATVLALLFLALNPALSLGGGDWGRVASMIVVSGLYLSAFYTLGLFISVKTNRPAVSLMVLLLAWIFFVIIYPNLSITAAGNLYPLPSEESLMQQKRAVSAKYREDVEKANATLQKIPTTNEDRLVFTSTWARIAEENYRIDREFGRSQTRQMKWAEWLSILSPAALYDQVMNRLARTDIYEYDRFLEGIHRLWQAHVERSELRYRDEEAYKRTPLPDFAYHSDSLGECLLATLPQWIVLIIFNLIFFTLAYTSFLGKDLR